VHLATNQRAFLVLEKAKKAPLSIDTVGGFGLMR